MKMQRSQSTSDISSDAKRIDHEIKLIHKQIALAEKTFANLIRDFTNITVDMTRLHSRHTELKETLSNVASEESPSLNDCLVSICKHVGTVDENLHRHVCCIENKVLQPISNSVRDCKVSRESLGHCSVAKKRRETALKSLAKHQRQRSPSTKAMKEHEKTQVTVLETTKQINQLEEEIKQFERSKAEKLRTWLRVYLHSSLAYHVKAVEEYTKAYQALSLIDVENHVEHFNSILFPAEEHSRVDFVRWNSFNTLSNFK